MTGTELKWVAPEYEHREKDVSWYWISIIIAVVLIFAAVWQKNYLFALFLLIAEIMVIVWASRPPRLVEFTLTDRELRIDGRKSYKFSEMDHFSIDQPAHSDWANAIFHFNRPFHVGLRVHVPKTRLAEVRAILHKGVEELHREESLLDIIEEYLGF